jgi:hypothetical protein
MDYNSPIRLICLKGEFSEPTLAHECINELEGFIHRTGIFAPRNHDIYFGNSSTGSWVGLSVTGAPRSLEDMFFIRDLFSYKLTGKTVVENAEVDQHWKSLVHSADKLEFLVHCVSNHTDNLRMSWRKEVWSKVI